jgi:hypothetical protein
MLAAAVAAGCGDDGISVTTGGELVTATTAAETTTTNPPPAPDAPQVKSMALSDGESPTATFGPSDPVHLQIDLVQMTDKVELNVRAEATHETISGVKGLTSEKLLERGDDFDGGEHTVLVTKSAPRDGWEEGVYTLTVAAEVIDRGEAYPPGTQYFEFDFTVSP